LICSNTADSRLLSTIAPGDTVWILRGERLETPRTLAEVDLTAIVAALAVETDQPDRDQRSRSAGDRRHLAQFEEQLDLANARFAGLEQENRELKARLAGIAALAAGSTSAPIEAAPRQPKQQPPPKSEPPPAQLIASERRSGARLTSFIPRPASSSVRRPPATPPRASPGVSLQPLPVSSRVADISMPGARICAHWLSCRERWPGDANRRRPQGSRRSAVGAFHTGRAAFLTVSPLAVPWP
jgi:hypothetical protein